MGKYKPLIILILVSMTAPIFGGNPASGKVKYGTYINARYQFEVKYPKELLKPEPPPDNNDGRNFYSADKQVRMTASGGHNSIPYTWKEEFRNAMDGLKDAQITYKTFKKNSFVISGYRNDRVFYHKKLKVMENDSEVFLSFIIEYPKKDKKTWDDITAACADSFRMSKTNIPTDTSPFGLGTNADQFK